MSEICVQRVEKIDAQGKTTTTAGAVAQLRGIDAAAAAYIRIVHERLAAEEAAAACGKAARR